MSYKYPTALDFALAVINDEAVPMAERIRMAIAVLPFQHGKIADVPAGKKEDARAKAAAAGADAGSSWGGDLAFGKAN